MGRFLRRGSEEIERLPVSPSADAALAAARGMNICEGGDVENFGGFVCLCGEFCGGRRHGPHESRGFGLGVMSRWLRRFYDTSSTSGMKRSMVGLCSRDVPT